jgi:CheY-like chemotaxis protein
MTNPPQTSDPGQAARRPRILLVEDHDMGRRSLARLLDAMGYEVSSANDGRSALELLKTATPPDYVLTDLRLPDLDGREVVVAASHLVPRPRIALVTGWDLEPEETARLGIDWVFLKPLDVQEIVNQLRQAPPADLLPDID